ncbi:MAG: electron transport complex subunit RsxC [Gammaproteobacteria bacterium]|nr:MAG: electron transport complex subunit RsxC [Gammaproteobacteria bacterium]
MNAKLWRFPGGLHLSGHKTESTRLPTQRARLPKRLTLPLHQHIGAEAKPVVAVGERVLKGQVIARAEGYVSAPVHASSSGTVIAAGDFPVPHPSGLSAPCIVIETDGAEQWCERHPTPDYTAQDPSHLRNLIREAGIVGLGGAGFPSFIKLNPLGKTVDTLILNAAECEPYITCDDMLMRERAAEIIHGIRIMRHALHAAHCIIGIEDNKPEAYAALVRALRELRIDGIQVIQVPTRYPAGGEKQLIHVLTGREVPSNGLPVHIGIVCHNVATAAAVHRAVQLGEPLISRYVTITGPGVPEPRNLEVLLGTPMAELLQQCGADPSSIGHLVMGGPMMGFSVHTSSAPVVKTTNCLLAAEHAPAVQAAMPCIRCGACAEACPANLLPQQLYWHAHAKEFDKAQNYNLFDCIECGCCAAVCPSHIPLVQYYRYAKGEIWTREREKQKADVARARHEFRLARLAQEKAEREARHAQKKAELAGKNAPRETAPH